MVCSSEIRSLLEIARRASESDAAGADGQWARHRQGLAVLWKRGLCSIQHDRRTPGWLCLCLCCAATARAGWRPLLGKWFSEAGGSSPCRTNAARPVGVQQHDAAQSFVAFLPCRDRDRQTIAISCWLVSF